MPLDSSGGSRLIAITMHVALDQKTRLEASTSLLQETFPSSWPEMELSVMNPAMNLMTLVPEMHFYPLSNPRNRSSAGHQSISISISEFRRKGE